MYNTGPFRPSVFDIFKLGIGPSSSHTVGPMRAAFVFISELANTLPLIEKIEVDLYASLAWTGQGHGIERAILLGLSGEKPENVSNAVAASIVEKVNLENKLTLLKQKTIIFNLKKDLHFLRQQSLPLHPNGMSFRAYNSEDQLLCEKKIYSIGGGFIYQESAENAPIKKLSGPFEFNSAKELLELCQKQQCKISQLMWKQECTYLDESGVRQELLKIWQSMQDCVNQGLHNEGILPGESKVRRRAPAIFKNLQELKAKRGEYSLPDPLEVLDWINLYALAVNEENAAGGRVVTAPTNGAAGIIPAVLLYYRRLCPGATDEGVMNFLLTSAAIAILYKKNASISGAEVGCQGEVGVACSMAAAGLTEVLGGSIYQVENAAEIAMEHNLGLTCDPIGGLVQIPCIERNAMGAIKAINASRLALKGDGLHCVSLDKVIKTMRDTGLDMQTKYKETSTGGLAVNVTEC